MSSPLPHSPALPHARSPDGDVAVTAASLRGRNIALLAADADASGTRALARAAEAPGGQGGPLRPDSLPATAGALGDVLTLLGRLYDAVLVDGVSPELHARVAACVDRPVLSVTQGARGDDDAWLRDWLADALS